HYVVRHHRTISYLLVRSLALTCTFFFHHFITMHLLHTDSSTTGRCFYDYWISSLPGFLFGCLFCFSFFCSRNNRNTCFFHLITSLDFIAHLFHHICFWSNKTNSCLLTLSDKSSVFTYESISWMNRINFRLLCNF